MIALSVSETKSNVHGSLEQRIILLKKGLCEYGSFAILPDSGMKTSMARFFGVLFGSLRQPTIYISEWGIWPSSENLDLFDSYRKAKGEMRSLGETPVHQFGSASEDAFVGIASFALYFVWDAEIFDLEGKCLVSVSHDEWVSIRTNDPQVRVVCDLAAKEGVLKKLAG